MKRHSLLTTVSVLAIPFVVLTGAVPAMAEDDGCGGMNAGQCLLSRGLYAVEHIGQPEKPKATLTVAPTAPTLDELNGAASKVNDLAITGVISAAQAAQAMSLIAAGGGNLVAAGGGNLVAAGGGNLVAAGGGNVVSNDGAGIVAANALALAGASAQKAQIADALLATGKNSLRSQSENIQQGMIAGMYQANRITDTQAMALSSLVAAGGGNLVAAGGGNLVAAGGGNAISENGSGLASTDGTFMLTGKAASLVAAGGGNLASAGGATLVAAGGGNLVAAGGGNLVAAGGGNLVAAGGGNLVSNAGGTLVSNSGSTLVSNSGSTLVAAGGGNFGASGAPIISDNSAGMASTASNLVAAGGGNLTAVQKLITQDGAGILSNAGGTGLKSGSVYGLNDVGSSDKGSKVAAYIQSVTGPTPAQLAAQKALTDAQKAVSDFSSAGDQVTRDVQALQNVKAGGNQSAINQMQAKLDADSAAMVNAGGVMMDKSKQVSAGDVAAVKKQLDDTVTHVGNNIKNATDAAKPQGPTQLQIDTASAAAATAKAASDVAAKSNDLVQNLKTQFGTYTPTNTADLLAINNKMQDAAFDAAKANLAKAQSDLVAMSKNGASAYDIKGQQDLITKAQSNVDFQNTMRNGDYAAKAIAVTTANSDLAAAKSVVDGLTKAYGSNRPSDPTQLATINTAMVVQALAQDKADQTAAAAAAVRLAASGASKSDVQTQTDLAAAKQNDMANILKANPKVAAAAGVAANADSKTVQAAINGLISNAASVSGAAVNLTAAQAAAALQALQQLKSGTGTASTTTSGGTDVTALLSTITKAASTYSIQSLSDKPANATTQVASTSPTGPATNATATQVANPATTGPATNVATAVTAAATAPVTPPVDKSELTPAVTQMLLQSAPGAIAAMQSAQQAALAKGDKATADGLGKNISNLQAQLDAAKTMPPPAATTVAATTTAVQVAGTSPTGPAANAPTTQVANPATTGPTANVAAAVTAAATAPAAPPVDKSELTPAVVQMLLTSGPATIAAMQSAQQAALAKGDKAMADGLGKDIVNLQSQVAAAKTMPPPATTTTAATTTTTAATAAKPATTTNPAATVVVAATSPTSPTTNAGSSATPANVATVPAAAKATETQSPSKITAEQGKAVQQALRTVPGNLTKTEEKNLSTLSALVDRAATKGLTPDEAAQLKSGLAALAEKHPKAEKQIGLTNIANSVAVNKPTAGDAKPVANTPADGKVAVTTPPAAKVENTPADGKVAVTTPPAAKVANTPADGKVAVTTPPAAKVENTPPDGKVAVTTPPAAKVANTPADGKVVVTTPPTAKTAPVETKAAVTTAPAAGGAAGVAKPGASQSPEGKVAVTTPPTSPVATPANTPGAKLATPAVVQPPLHEPEHGAMKPEVAKPIVATTNPTVQPVKPSPAQEMHREAPAVMKPTPAPIVSHVEQPKVVTPSVAHVTAPVVTAPKPPAPVVTAPKPPTVATAAPKPSAPPAAKPQTCTPNMVNGKMMGMTCH